VEGVTKLGFTKGLEVVLGVAVGVSVGGSVVDWTGVGVVEGDGDICFHQKMGCWFAGQTVIAADGERVSIC